MRGVHRFAGRMFRFGKRAGKFLLLLDFPGCGLRQLFSTTVGQACTFPSSGLRTGQHLISGIVGGSV